MTIPFPSHLNGYCYEGKKESYGPQFSEAYSEASHINNSISRKEKDPGSFTLCCIINNVCFDNALVDLGSSVSVMPLSNYLNLGLGELAHTKLAVKLADMTVKYPKGIAKNMLTIFVYARAKIYVYESKITLRVREERIIFTSVKPASSVIKRVYMLSLRERMELDLEARLMGETLVINRSLDPLNRDYIKLNDLNEPFELRRNQGDDLMPTIVEGEVIEEFRSRDDELDAGIDDYPRMGDVIFGSISDDESSNDGWRRWESHEITHHDHNEIENETHDERQELYGIETREVPVCQIKRYNMIKYSFKDEEEYVVVKEDEYNDLTITSEEACRAYQEIFRMMDEGWMVTRTETLKERNIDEYWWRNYKSGDLEVLES
ncbi:hypothetical protein Tco_0927177 [Tanacetum coccineum]